MKKKRIGMIVSTLMALAVLSGCGNEPQSLRDSLTGKNNESKVTPKDNDSNTDSADNNGKVDNNDANDPKNDPGNDPGNKPDTDIPDGGNAPQPQTDGLTFVHDVEGLLMAIEPGAKIVMEPGVYNLSDYLTEQWNDPDEGWEKIRRKGHVWMEDVFDGIQLHFNAVSGLSIIGRSSDRADTQILTDPRYANLFTFHDSSDVLLSNLTMGHTDRGECVGNVLDFQGCTDVLLVNMDLFGCGVYGISACSDTVNGSGNFHIYDSTIRDCSYGPLWIEDNTTGDWIFSHCELTGSLSGGFFGELEEGKLYFYDCVFGNRETENFSFRQDTVTQNCEWGEIEYYPEYPDIEE